MMFDFFICWNSCRICALGYRLVELFCYTLYFCLCSHPTLVIYDLCVVGVPIHEHVHMYFLGAYKAHLPIFKSGVMFIRVGLRICIAYRHSLCDVHGYVGYAMEGTSLPP